MTREVKLLALLAGGVIVVGMSAAGALLVTTSIAKRGVAIAAQTLLRSETEAMLASVAVDLHALQPPPTQAQIEQIVAAHATEGLRYLALTDPNGDLTIEAGEATLAAQKGDFASSSDRLRLRALLPPPRTDQSMPRPRELPSDAPMQPPPPRLLAGPPHDHVPTITLEIVPRGTIALDEAMGRANAVATIAATLLIALSSIVAASLAKIVRAQRRIDQERRLAELGRMSSVLAHELRNPLAALKGHAELVAESVDAGTSARASADRVVYEASRLAALTDDLLAFVREGPLDPRSIELQTFVDDLVAPFDRGRIDLDLATAPTTIVVDRSRLAQALTNVVRNALQASDETGADRRVAVAVTVDRSRVIFEVRDHGNGLPSGEGERIFEAFVTHRVHGTGLGLAVARRAIEQIGGTISASTHPDGGALFRLCVPLDGAAGSVDDASNGQNSSGRR